MTAFEFGETRRVQLSISRDIGRALVHLRHKGGIVILVVEQNFEWARDIANDIAVMDSGAIMLSGTWAGMDETAVRGRMTV